MLWFFNLNIRSSLILPMMFFYNRLALVKQLNLLIKNGYRLTPDDVICMALEDFTEIYLSNVQALLKRVEEA